MKNLYIHNLTELLIYPGLAGVFVPLLSIWTMIFLLVLISVYDMWAVWHSGIMQKMAKYQINKLKIFSGFFCLIENFIQELAPRSSRFFVVKLICGISQMLSLLIKNEDP